MLLKIFKSIARKPGTTVQTELGHVIRVKNKSVQILNVTKRETQQNKQGQGMFRWTITAGIYHLGRERSPTVSP